MSQFTKRAARAAPRSALLGAPQARPRHTGPRLRREASSCSDRRNSTLSRGGRDAAGAHTGTVGTSCPTSLRCSAWGTPSATRYAPQRALRSNRRSESVTKRAARASPRPALLAAPEIAPAASRPPRAKVEFLLPPHEEAFLRSRGPVCRGRFGEAVGTSCPTPLRCSAWGCTAQLATRPEGRFAQTGAVSQFTKRAARASPRPALLAAPEIAPAASHPPRDKGKFPRAREKNIPANPRACGPGPRL